ncbi:MAG TPA: hypothetical protein VJ183_02245 [Chloroflexia bacterium]|nr:hypothetical protein [Chloroflexia bacterium]
MSTQKEQRVINVPFGPGRTRQQTAPAPDAPETADKPKVAAPMQSLAAELHQAALQGVFEYPQGLRLVARVATVLLVALAAFHVAMVMIPSTQPASSFVGAVVSWRMLGALLGAVVAFGLAAFVANLFQTIHVTPQGLGIAEITGKRMIAWKHIGVLRVMEMPSRERYMVMIPVMGATKPPTPAPMLKLMPALLGASRTGERGIVITSNIKNFERLLQLIVSYLAQEAGQVVPAIEAFVDEHAVMPLGQLAVESNAALNRMARPSADTVLDPYGMPANEDNMGLPWRTLLTRQAWIALAPTVLMLADILLRNGEKPLSWVQGLWVIAILAVGVGELPFISKLVQAVGELVVGGGHLKRTVWAYLELQTPRVLMIVLGAALMGLGVPAVVAQILWLLGILVTTALLTRFVQKLYHITIPQALMASIGAFLFQFALLAFYFGVR